MITLIPLDTIGSSWLSGAPWWRAEPVSRSSPPVRDGIAGAGKAAVEAGRSWDKAAGPLLAVLTPAA
jgi:hypothetical protein